MIDVIFPKNAVYMPTTVTLSLISDHDDFAIETPHVVAFEIQPHDLLLYRPVSVMINYAQTVSDVEKTLIFRENTISYRYHWPTTTILRTRAVRGRRSELIHAMPVYLRKV